MHKLRSDIAPLLLFYISNDTSIDRARQAELNRLGLSFGTRCRANRQMKYPKIPDFHRYCEHFGLINFENGGFEDTIR
jgi:hypothetical protein